MRFEAETTNQREFQPFVVKQRPKTAKPKIDVITTSMEAHHWETLNKRQYKDNKGWKPPMVDFIPYP
jgi:hypothetical protein